MLKRITSKWTISRAIYFVLGLWVISEAVASHQYFGILFGGYFASMGLFAFGCAAGNCGVPMQKNNLNANDTQDIKFEEIK
jgi:acyl-coenzyme A thioesterase PaaI-like protein